MGDRANVFSVSKHQTRHSKGVYFYTHWHGSKLPVIVQNALKKRQRWGDEQYLNRIIFEEMIKNNIGETTGFGISPYLADGGDRVIVVNHNDNTVELNGVVYTFEEYIALYSPSW